jgi:hypothetical protein
MPHRGLVILVLVSACGDNLVGVPLEELELARERARCDRLARCGLFADAAACTGFFRARPDPDLAAAISSGLVRYDGPSAARCLDALAAQSCEPASREARILPPVCTQMLEGTLPGSAPCALDAECVSGRCDVPACPELCCTGTCRSPRPTGEPGDPCELDRDCIVDTACGSDQLCHPLAGEGARCAEDADCDYLLGCIGPTELMPGNCRTLPRIGESCPYERCAELGAVCTVDRICARLALPGEPCASTADCSPAATCDPASSRCVTLPTLGMTCSGSCAGESWCDAGGSRTCTAPRPDDQRCASDLECASLFCAEGPVFDACAARPLCF